MEYYRKPKKRKKRRHVTKRFLVLLDVVLVGVLIFASWKLIDTLVGYYRAEKTYDAIAESVVQTAAPVQATAVPAPQSTAEPVYVPSEVPIAVDFEKLRKENKDVIGWLYSTATPINYPILQTDDNEYYLTRDFHREKSSGGALYFDFRNNVSAPDENLILYGHRMKDDSMFGSLVDYINEPYAKEHPKMYLLTEGQNYRVEIFACRTVRATSLHYFETVFYDDASYQGYLDKALEQSYWKAPFAVDTTYPTLTMVTCSTYGHADDPRLLVHGRLIPVN